MADDEHSPLMHSASALPRSRQEWQPAYAMRKVVPMRHLTGLAYFAVLAQNGGVLVLTSLSMNKFAKVLSVTPSHLSNLWIAKAGGSLVGLVFATWLFQEDNTNKSHFHMGVSSMLLGLTCWLVVKWVAPATHFDLGELGLLYGLFGCFTAILDVGVTACSRRIQGDEAGLWLSGNTIAFGLGCELAALMQFVVSDKYIFETFALVSGLIGVALLVSSCLPKPIVRSRSSSLISRTRSSEALGDSESGSSGGGGGGSANVPRKTSLPPYYFEWLFSSCIFCVFGAKIAASSVLYQYIEDTVPAMTKHKYELLVLVVWTTCTVARLCGVLDQSYMPLHFIVQLITRAQGSVLLALVFVALLALESSSQLALWVGMIGYFTAAGPTLGYMYDASCRITEVDARGAAILKLGFHMGSSFVPFFTDRLWPLLGAYSLQWVLAVTAFVPLMVLHTARNKVVELGVSSASYFPRAGDMRQSRHANNGAVAQI